MVNGQGQHKDTLNNVRSTREFVVNIVSEDICKQMNLASAAYPPEVDEFVKSGLTPLPSDLVGAPRVAESKASLECKLFQIIDVSPKPMGGSLVLGEVVRFHLDDSIVSNFRVDPDLLNPIGRMGGLTYSRTKDRFDLERPQV